MNCFGLIGKNISYSFSEKYFEEKFRNEKIENCTYRIFDLENIEEVQGLFADNDLKGLNVTIPYKEKIIPFLDKLSPEVEKIGAVNCIKIQDGVKTGYNTDVYGFENSLNLFLEDYKPKTLILGDGGAAKAVKYVLNKLNIPFRTVSRKGEFTFLDLNQSQILSHQLIVNCTPIGAYPNVNLKPDLPYQYLTDHHYLFDLIYNPPKTLFLEFGEKAGSRIKNGMEMLKFQAEKSWEIWLLPL